MDQHARIVSQSIAVVRIKAGRQATTSLIPKEVALRVERARVHALRFQRIQLFLHAGHDELLRLDLRDLHVPVRIAVQRQLVAQRLRQIVEQLARRRLQVRGDVGLLGVAGRDDLVELLDQRAHFGDELDEAFGEKDHAVVLAELGALHDQIHHFLRDLLHRLLLLRDLLADERVVRVRLEGALHGDVRRRAAHQAHEMVVFLRGQRVHADVPDQLRVDLARRVKTERHRDVVVLQIAVDRLRAADHVRAVMDALEVLRQQGGVRVGVVAADDDQTVQFQIVAHLRGRLELPVSETTHTKQTWSSPLILSRPEPIISKPPMLRYWSMNLSSIFTYLPVNTPRGP